MQKNNLQHSAKNKEQKNLSSRRIILASKKYFLALKNIARKAMQ
jgi:hypothetical protein